MKFYRDPTADIAIANVMRQQRREREKQERRQAKQNKPKEERKKTGKRYIAINRAELFCALLRRELRKEKEQA